MLICPSEVGNTPVGMPVGWSLPACGATSLAISQREAWKSSMKICASSSDVVTQRPTPVRSRSKIAIMMPSASRLPAVRSSIGNADAHRALAGQAGDRHQPTHALGDLIHAGAMAVRTGLAETADAAIDDARVHRPDVVVRHLQPVLHLGAHVLDDDVGGFHQAHERCVAFGRLQVQRHRALVAMQVLEVEAVAVAGDILAVGGGRLDLDDVGAPVRQVPHAGGPGPRQGQVQHLQAVQRHAGLGLGEQLICRQGFPASLVSPPSGADTPPQSPLAQECTCAGGVVGVQSAAWIPRILPWCWRSMARPA